MLVRQQEPYPQSAPPAVVGKMVQIPYVTVPLYAALLIALGWFGGEQWRNKPEPQPMSQPVAHAAIDEDTLPPLRYSAHVYASLAEKRSIVLNGQSWKEGDSPLPNLVIEQIQQDLTVFSFNGKTFTLAALDDWPGGAIEESPQAE